MTNVLPSIPDDLAQSLRPLDFSALLPLAHDPILSSAGAVPRVESVWPAASIFSPLCSASSRLAPPNPSDPVQEPTPWIANLSPLLRQSERDAGASALSSTNVKSHDLPLWTSAIAGSPLAQDSAFATSSLNFNFSSATSTTLDGSNSAYIPATSATSPANACQSGQSMASGQRMLSPSSKKTGTQQIPHGNFASTTEQDHQVKSSFTHSTALTATMNIPQPVQNDDVCEESVSAGGAIGITVKEVEEKKEAKIVRKVSQTMSSIDKAAERRRKNRESSSRCYYNRKRIIETLERQISAEKTRLTTLYDKALELRHENARLKKNVVTKGIALPTIPRTVHGAGPSTAFPVHEYVQLLQSCTFQTKH